MNFEASKFRIIKYIDPKFIFKSKVRGSIWILVSGALTALLLYWEPPDPIVIEEIGFFGFWFISTIMVMVLLLFVLRGLCMVIFILYSSRQTLKRVWQKLCT